MLMLISAHSATVTSTLVNVIKFWCLEQQHDQLETLQLFCCPFCALFSVSVLLDHGIKLLGHGLEVIALVRRTRNLGSCPTEIADCWFWRHVRHCHAVRLHHWVTIIHA